VCGGCSKAEAGEEVSKAQTELPLMQRSYWVCTAVCGVWKHQEAVPVLHGSGNPPQVKVGMPRVQQRKKISGLAARAHYERSPQSRGTGRGCVYSVSSEQTPHACR
jgi:hypothetical protein